MTTCGICLAATTEDAAHHAGCLNSLFGTLTLPSLDFDLPELHREAVEMVGKMSISGMQEKVSLAFSGDRSKLQLATIGGRYILKPDTGRFAALPQNEHATMVLARRLGIETPPLGLLTLKDGTAAYIIKRFDRLDHGAKLPVEDFCQLAERDARDKYDGSGELCVRLLRKFASEPGVQIQKLYRLLLFGWWTGNGDMHLKNFSLLTGPDGIRRLSPAYDLLCTALVIPGDPLALPVGGRRSGLHRRDWLSFAEYCKLPERAATRLIAQQVDALETALQVVQASFLPPELKTQYEALLRENTAALQA